ncbi:MAG TPA: LysR family transcriptional regulator [Burkholderiales bacterium]|nr:LysR family transcriptional regulator [Burkholderiales bacterium]
MNITSRQLKAFLLTARYQSFSRAAERLFITQSGMSVLVRELEAQLGFRLFERTTRKVRLTEFGSRLLPIADRSLLELEAAATNIGRSASAAKGSVILGAAPFAAAELLPKAIAAYALREPQTQVRLIDAAGSRLVDMVRYGEVDIAVSGVRHEAPGVQCASLARFRLALVRAADQPGPSSRDVRWSDVAAQKLIGLPPDYSLQQLIDEQLARVGRHARPELACNYLETQIAMVEAGAGMAVIPAFAAPACARRRVVLHPIVDPAVTSDLYSIASFARKPSRAAHGFTAFLKSYFSDLTEQWPAHNGQATLKAAAVV